MSKWTATIDAKAGKRYSVQPGSSDTLDGIVQAGLRDARAWIEAGLVDEYTTLVVYKTTKARGTQRDRSYRIFRDGDILKAQFMGA